MLIQPITFIRLNSKRLPNKSILELGGKKLSNYMIEKMSKVNNVATPIVYSSEDFLSSENLKYRFLKRQKHLDEDVLFNDLMNSVIDKIDADFVLFFCVTSPFIRVSTINDIIEKIKSKKYDSAFTAYEVKNFCWYKDKPVNYDLDAAIPPTQSLKPIICETSSFYLFRKDLFLENERRIGYNPFVKIVSQIEGHDIDYPEDFEIAKALIATGRVEV